ncbi:MAG: hypothetical protein A3K76_05605 [Euryarchaeota archaeon RBG_13_57_23]|nr:MAG: hypothetical protein A3K76_05605 [Euryarchaeota archaeon RBG_13_57_23]
MVRLVVSPYERMLLHLAEMDRFRDDPEVPLGASQEGIAQRLQIQIHATSRALASMETEGLISDRLAHVRGAPKRRRAYFLTEKGRQAAAAIKADISKRKVALELEGRVTEQPFEDAIRNIASATGMTPTFNEVLDAARAGDMLTSESFSKPASPRAAPEFVMRAQGRPSVDGFYGREAERKLLTEAIGGKEVSTVLICGMPGIGKSTLASRLFEEHSGKRSMFWYSFRDWETEASFLGAFTEFLDASGRSAASNAVRRRMPVSALFGPLVDDLSGADMLLFLDDVHKPVEKSLPVLPIVFEAARVSRSTKVILISRSVPSFFSKSGPESLTIELSGLDRDSAWRMAQNLDAKDTIRVVDESHGHPFLIRLMAKGATGSAKGDLIAYIEKEVYSTISEDERKVLQLLSIFRHPVPAEALSGVDYSVVAGLKQRALVFEQEAGISTHDLLTEFFSSRTNLETKLALHRQSAAYCETRSDVEWKLETLYHFVEGRDWNGARRISLGAATELANEFPEESLALISKIPLVEGAQKELAELLFIRGQLHEATGRAESALSDFELSLSMLDTGTDADKRAAVLEAIAKLQSHVRRWSDSLSAHEKALRLYEQSGDTDGQARELLNISGVHMRKGDLDTARETYMKALALATRAENRPAQAACLNNLGLLDWERGRLKDAEVKLKESIRLAHVVKDHIGEAKGLENLAGLFRLESRQSEMVSLLRESSEAFRRAGELVEFKRMQAAVASALGDQGGFAEGIEICNRVLENPEFRKRQGLFQRHSVYDTGDAALSAALVDLLRASGDLKKALRELERHSQIARSIGDRSIVARGMLMRSMVSEAGGDLDTAIEMLDDAVDVLRGEGNAEGLIAANMRRGMVEEKRGNEEAAVAHYEEAARQAELVGNEFARMLALENVPSLRKQ